MSTDLTLILGRPERLRATSLEKRLSLKSVRLQGLRVSPRVNRMAYKTRAITPWQERFWRYVTPTTNGSCWEWQGCRNEHGYGRLNRGRAGAGQIKAHRASYEINNGPIPAGLSVCHRCDNPPCVNPAHLFLGTMAVNLQDAASKGRTGPQRGGSAVCRKITDAQVLELREAAVAGSPYQPLAERYGITEAHVSAIALGKCRRDAGGPFAPLRRTPR